MLNPDPANKTDNRLIRCPQATDVHYFAWHCRHRMALGVPPCAECREIQILEARRILVDHVRTAGGAVPRLETGGGLAPLFITDEDI